MSGDAIELRRDQQIRSSKSAYAIHDVIGTGRFSRVYRATDTGDDGGGVPVAIKVLAGNEDDQRFGWYLYAKELDMLDRVKRSPLRDRYARLRDALRLGTGPHCIVMDRLGTTLCAALQNVGGLPLSMCRMIVRQIAQGLAGLKSMGIVHADLKPDNVMFAAGVGNNHRVKIIDFGWAFYASDAPRWRRKQIQAVPYRAPEVCFRGRLDHGLDAWSLGCIMPEIVTGVKLFDVADEETLVKLIIRTLHVPGELLVSDSQRETAREEVDLSAGWIRFQDFKAKTAHGTHDPQKAEDIEWFADLVYRLLTVMPGDRITAADALAHPFLTMAHFIRYPSTMMTKRNAQMMEKCMLREI